MSDLLGQVLRIFTDTVASSYRKRLADRDIPGGQYGAGTVIQRANSDLATGVALPRAWCRAWCPCVVPCSEVRQTGVAMR